MKTAIVIVMLAMLLTSMFAVPMALAEDDSEERITLDSETRPSMVFNAGDKSYTIELVSASDSAATIRVTDNTGEYQVKDISEGSEATFLNEIEIEVEDSNENNFRLTAEIKIKLDDDDDSDDSEDDNRGASSGNPELVDAKSITGLKKRPIVAGTSEESSLTAIQEEAGISLSQADIVDLEISDGSSRRIFIVYFGTGKASVAGENDVRILLVERKKIDSDNSGQGSDNSLTALKTESKFRGKIQTSEFGTLNVKGTSLSSLEVNGRDGVKGTLKVDTENNLLILSIEDADTYEYKVDLQRKVLRPSGGRNVAPGTLTGEFEKRNFLDRFFSRDRDKSMDDNSLSEEEKAIKEERKEARKTFLEVLKEFFSREKVDSSDDDSNSGTNRDAESLTGLSGQAIVKAKVK